ncbi:hypothetical protein [Amnibacterium soli]|uniref:hypothetical protein n=1 Tax=Amnibacterium soli TaxID=1282736 RepID=UPI0031E6E306
MRSWFWIASAMSYGFDAFRVQRSAVVRMIDGTFEGIASDCSSPAGTETDAARSCEAVASTCADRTT